MKALAVISERSDGEGDAEPSTPVSAAGLAPAQPGVRLDASGLQKLLKESVETGKAAQADGKPAEVKKPESWKPVARKVVKSLVAALMVAAVGWGPVTGLLQTTSVEAVVNARLVSLRAPIDGQLVAKAGMPAPGSMLNGALTLVKVVNERADRTRLDDLRRQLGQIEDDRHALGVRLAAAREQVEALTRQTARFLEGRIAQLEARRGELESQIVIAEARHKVAAANHVRFRTLVGVGATSGASLEQAERDSAVSAASVSEAKYRLQEIEVELSSARSGSFLGDSYNDRPSSAQRLDEMRQRVSDLGVELETRGIQAARLDRELAYETARLETFSTASVAVPVKGRVWEVLAAPGESVNRGQDLMRLLDCSGAVVTAAVDEGVYNRLHVGMPATFQFRHGSETYQGRVVNLTGIAGAPANFAIEPSALDKESYRVTVAVPALAGETGCDVGRTGRVVFDGGSERGLLDGLADQLSTAWR